MNTFRRMYATVLLLAGVSFFALNGCKKDNATSSETDLTSDVTYQTEDHAMFSTEDDAISDDVNTFMESDLQLGGRNQSVLCGATVAKDTTGLLKNTITITYSGANCAGTRTRTGTVVITLPKRTKWKDVGAVATVMAQNLKITRIADSKSVTINGTKTITNVSGHLLRELATGSVSSVIHTVTSSNMSASFDNGTSRLWQIAKQRSFTYSGGYVISETGTATVDGVNNIAIWGTNRLGQAFSTQVLEPLVIKQSCDFRLVSGKISHTKLTRPITVTFGLDASGNPTSCPGTGGSYYFKAEWTSLITSTAHTIIKPY